MKNKKSLNFRILIIFFFVIFSENLLIKSVGSDNQCSPLYIINDDSLTIFTHTIDFRLKRHSTGVIYIDKISRKYNNHIFQSPAPTLEKWKICPIWQLDFYDSNKKINSNSAKFLGWKIEDNNKNFIVNLFWKIKDDNLALKINVLITIPKISSSTFWEIILTSDNEREFDLEKCVFPIIGDFKLSSKRANVRFATPSYYGQEYLNAERTIFNSVYPSSKCQMQFIAYYNDNTNEGIYICALDSSGHQKIFANHLGNDKIPYARAEPAILPVYKFNNFWKIPYKIEVKPFKGNWYQAAKFYRNWLTQNVKWHIPNQKKMKKFIFDNILWIRSDLGSDTLLNFQNSNIISNINKMQRVLHYPATIQLYNWHRYPFDQMYPEYFPTRLGFSEFIIKNQEKDCRIIPYINGRIADIKYVIDKNYITDSVCLFSHSKSVPFIVNEYSSQKFVTMCPSSSFWQKKIFNISNKLIRDYKVDGIYFDQICNSKAYKCQSDRHGHMPDSPSKYNYSSGTHWVNGYRQLLNDIKKNIIGNKNQIILSENAAEPWNDLIDVFLMVNCPLTDEYNSFRVIPLYPAVYSGYTTTIGFEYYYLERDITNITYRLACSFLWGSQIGRIRSYFPEETTLVNFTDRLCKSRQILLNFFNFGEMILEPELDLKLNPIVIKDRIKLADGSFKYVHISDKPIKTALWKFNVNEFLILLVNYSQKDFSTKDQDLFLNKNFHQIPAGSYNLILYDNGIRKQTESIYLNGEYHLDVNMNPYSILAYHLIKI